jgi:thiol-disulfide isomerase/thioredoxin
VGRGLKQRLLALGGLVAIVGGAALVLWLAGVLGGQGGGTTASGVEIEPVALLDTPPFGGLDVAPREGSLAPDFEISDYEGTRHRLSDFRGTPVYVNFWATWCIPCQRELPDIQELADRHGDGLVVVTVNRREPLDDAQAYFRNIEKLNGEGGISFDVNGLDPDDTLYDQYRALGMPLNVFIDARGVVGKVYNSAIDLATMEEAAAALRPAD